jgi:hypothetical protein
VAATRSNRLFSLWLFFLVPTTHGPEGCRCGLERLVRSCVYCVWWYYARSIGIVSNVCTTWILELSISFVFCISLIYYIFPKNMYRQPFCWIGIDLLYSNKSIYMYFRGVFAMVFQFTCTSLSAFLVSSWLHINFCLSYWCHFFYQYLVVHVLDVFTDPRAPSSSLFKMN